MHNAPRPLALFILTVAALAAAPAAAQSPACFDVSLRGGTAEICAAVYENAEAGPNGTSAGESSRAKFLASASRS